MPAQALGAHPLNLFGDPIAVRKSQWVVAVQPCALQSVNATLMPGETALISVGGKLWVMATIAPGETLVYYEAPPGPVGGAMAPTGTLILLTESELETIRSA